LTDYDFSSFLGSPMSLAVCVAILLGAVLSYRALRKQWTRHRVTDATRSRESAALLFVSVAALLVVAAAHAYVDRQDRDTRMQAELAQKNALAGELRAKINAEIARVRALLADRTVRRIEQQQLSQARDELARFQSINDPRITQMLALIDTELEIRRLVALSLRETAADKLFGIYTRLSALVPDHAAYRESAERYAQAMKGEAAMAGAPKPN